jgi:diguanylate cyclase (GGDEF)-like protein
LAVKPKRQNTVNLLVKYEHLSRPLRIVIEYVFIGAVGAIDFLTGYELAFSLFYVLPISLAAWFIGRQQGILASITSAFVWLGADIVSGSYYSHPLIPLWNTSIRLSLFLIIALLLSTLKSSLEREKELARKDYLTGAVNSRHFFELVQMEMDRSQRYAHPLTLAYMDLDNFKTVNDRYGHPTGDWVLCTIIGYTEKNLRKTDIIARLGGDEFALLLPETNQEQASIVLSKIRNGLLEEMKKHHWPVTFSIGVITCHTVFVEINELINMADALMYEVKHSGKNAIQYSIYEDSPSNA